MVGVVAVLGLGNHIHEARIDHGRTGDANFRIDIKVRTVPRIGVAGDYADILTGNGRPQVHRPQRSCLRGSSASKAYTLLCSVATYTTFLVFP